MKKRILAICDLETEYAVRFGSFLDKKALPFEVRVFSQTEQLLEFCRQTPVEMILISESAFDPCLKELKDAHIVILNESGNVFAPEYTNVDKYQSSEAVLREVMCYCAGQDKTLPEVRSAVGARLIGVYSPVKRCMQTSFALTLGQIMAAKSKVLYLNLEGYSGFSRLMQKEFHTELSDLLYYVRHAGEKLLYRLESMVQDIGGLSYVPPVFSPQDFMMVSPQDWIELLGRLQSGSGYEYIILDLSDYMQGLFEVLRMCGCVYTIVEKDWFARAKIEQYEQLLKNAAYEDVLGKTEKLEFPVFRHLPVSIEHLPFSELAEYIRAHMEAGGYENFF